MELLEKYTLDRTQWKMASSEETWEDKRDLEFWLEKTDQERLEGIEFLRQMNYGQHYSTQGLQRVLTVTQREVR